MKPTIPFVVEEQGKSQVKIVPQDFRPSPEAWEAPGAYRRGRPGMGALALYFGEENVRNRLHRGPVILSGLCYDLKDATDQLDAFLRRRAGYSVRQTRAALKKMGLPPDADVQALYNAIASRAKSASRADRRGT